MSIKRPILTSSFDSGRRMKSMNCLCVHRVAARAYDFPIPYTRG